MRLLQALLFIGFPFFVVGFNYLGLNSQKVKEWLLRIPFRNLWSRHHIQGQLLSNILIIDVMICWILTLTQFLLLYAIPTTFTDAILFCWSPSVCVLIVAILFGFVMRFHPPTRVIDERVHLARLIEEFLQIIITRVETITIPKGDAVLDVECGICLEDFSGELNTKYNCQCASKKVCRNCILRHFQISNKCPWCRMPIQTIQTFLYQ